MKKLFVIIAIMMGMLWVPTVSYAQLGGLVKAAKKTAKQAVGNKGDKALDAVSTGDVGNVASGVTSVARGEAPWPMKKWPSYNGKEPREFLLNIVDLSDEEISALRDQMYARYKTNVPLVKSGDFQAEEENDGFVQFYGQIVSINTLNYGNAPYKNGGLEINPDTYYLVTGRPGGGIGCVVFHRDGKNFRFSSFHGDGVYLDDEDLKTAKEAALRMRKFQLLTKGIEEMFTSVGEKCDEDFRRMSYYSGMYATAIETACQANTPANIERKARPANGSLHASLKAQALAVAKAQDSSVVDVIITSNSWDVKMKGVVPSHRNVSGYYVTKDEHGLQCRRRLWTEDYQGNGKYGKLRAGGVGTESPFYIK